MDNAIEQSKEMPSRFPLKLFGGNQIGALIALILLVIALSIASAPFRSWSNIQEIVMQASIIAVIAAGQTFVIMTGGIDLSVGSTVGLVGVLSALVMSSDTSVGGMGHSMWLAIFVGLVAGGLVGLFNGVLVAKVKMPPFIVTLGTMSVARGLAYVLAQGQTIDGLPNVFTNVAMNQFLGISWLTWIMIVVFVICGFLIAQTRFGKYTLATGGNETATVLSGIRSDRIKILVYTLCGVLSAIAGLMLASRLQSGIGTNGNGYELDAIAGVVIGGTSLTGGTGSITGTLIGVLIMETVQAGLVLLNVNQFWDQVVMGFIILIAVYTDILRQRIAKNRKLAS